MNCKPSKFTVAHGMLDCVPVMANPVEAGFCNRCNNACCAAASLAFQSERTRSCSSTHAIVSSSKGSPFTAQIRRENFAKKNVEHETNCSSCRNAMGSAKYANTNEETSRAPFPLFGFNLCRCQSEGPP